MSKLPHLNPAKHRKLFDTAGELTDLKNNPKKLSKQDYGDLLRRVCISFTESLDAGLADAIYAIQNQVNDPQNKHAAQAIFDDVVSFAEYLKFQRDHLEACGATQTMAVDTVRHIGRMRDQMIKAERARIEDSEFNAELLVAAITQSKIEVCSAADKVDEYLSQRQALHLFMKRALIATGSVVLFGTFVALTGGAAAIFAGTATAAGVAKAGGFISASGLAGSLLIAEGRALQDPVDAKLKPSKRK